MLHTLSKMLTKRFYIYLLIYPNQKWNSFKLNSNQAFSHLFINLQQTQNEIKLSYASVL